MLWPLYPPTRKERQIQIGQNGSVASAFVVVRSAQTPRRDLQYAYIFMLLWTQKSVFTHQFEQFITNAVIPTNLKAKYVRTRSKLPWLLPNVINLLHFRTVFMLLGKLTHRRLITNVHIYGDLFLRWNYCCWWQIAVNMGVHEECRFLGCGAV
jgi:hypothetical protein